MTKRTIVICIGLFCGILQAKSQPIPYGVSFDSLKFSYSQSHEVYFYKPTGYDTLNGSIWWAVHGLGGSGAGTMADLQDLADSMKIMIVAPTMYQNWFFAIESYSLDSCWFFNWYTWVFRDTYEYILNREGRDSIPVYLSGFSAGGQFVTRYMLIRQAFPDNIPIMHAVSISPFFYTFCVDSLAGVDMRYPCGLSPNTYMAPCGTYTYGMDYICNEDVIQYYNENYTVLIGDLDTAYIPSFPCYEAQGMDRYERAVNFYNFSDTDAVARGTALQWQYSEVPDVGHNGWAMYHTPATGDSVPIAVRLLFETPYHTVPQLAPVADFSADTTVVDLPNAYVQFFNESALALSYLWDFGDGTTSTAINPLHLYTYADTFTVTLIATNGTGCHNPLPKYHYITVQNPVYLNETTNEYWSIRVYPNPAKDEFTISGNFELPARMELYDVMGGVVNEAAVGSGSSRVDVRGLAKGLYLLRVAGQEGIFIQKIILE